MLYLSAAWQSLFPAILSVVKLFIEVFIWLYFFSFVFFPCFLQCICIFIEFYFHILKGFVSPSYVCFLEFIEEIVHTIFEFFQASLSTFFDIFWRYSTHSFGFFVWNFVEITVIGGHLYENVRLWRKLLIWTFPVASVFPLGFTHLKQLC